MSVVNITLTISRRFAWQSAKRWQDPDGRAAIMRRFWASVQRGESDGCWLWTGTRQHGYGYFVVADHQRVRAHIFAWLTARGPIAHGLDVCHNCDTPACVNPTHLRLASHRENLRESVRKGRKNCFGRQKLTALDAVAIRRWCAAGWLQKDVAHAFGVARNTVSGIVRKTSWAHLPDASEAGCQAS